MGTEAAQLVQWTESNMPLIQEIGDEFEETKPFDGIRIGLSIHLEVKTAALLMVLRRGGADVVAAGNYGTTQDEIVGFLRERGIDARGSRSDSRSRHLAVVRSIMECEPDLLLDNGADLIKLAVDMEVPVLGASEETTSGRMRLDTELAGSVRFPVIVINDSPLKAIVENKHAVGQSVYESFCRLTNLMPQARSLLVVGYGWCGRGIAHYARANGMHVQVAEVDEIKALEAVVDGFRVGSVEEMIAGANLVITATGAPKVVGEGAVSRMRDGVMLANAGHFDWEIDLTVINGLTAEIIPLGNTIERHVLVDGRTVDVIARGRMINLAGEKAKGNSIQSMDLGLALQARSLERIRLAPDSLVAGAQPVPDDINRRVAARFVSLLQGTGR